MARRHLWVVALLSAASFPAWGVEHLVVNTDIGHSLDDVIALSLLVKSDEVEILAVVTSGPEGEKRARMARHLLYLLGRDDIPVAAGGSSEKDRTPVGPMFHFSEDFGRVLPPEMDGTRLFLDAVHSAWGKVTVLSLGPLTTVADALAADPSVLERIESIVCSPGSESAWEYFRRDPAGIGAALEAGATVVVASPEIRGKLTWADMDPAVLDGLPVGRVLAEMAVYGHPDRSAALVDVQIAAYGLQRRFMQVRPEVCSPEMIGLASGTFTPRSVVFLESFDARSFRPLLMDRLRDPRPTIIACLNRVQAHQTELRPALGTPLAGDLQSLRRYTQEIQSQDRLRTSDRESGMQIIHRLLKNLEILQEHEAGRRMTQRLSMASALLGEIRVSLPEDYRRSGRFRGVLGDRAELTLGLENRGPFDVPRARITVYDWTLRKAKSESIIDLRSGTHQSHLFTFPLPADVQYPEFLRAYVVLGWQFEAGWTKLPFEAWIQVIPPFLIRLAERPTEDIVSVVVRTSIDRRQQVQVRINPLCGQWAIPGNERTIEFEPPSGMDVGSIFPLLNDRSREEQPVRFAIPPLPRSELNALRITATNGSYRTSTDVVFPRPGSGVVWLSDVHGATPGMELVAGQWALTTEPGTQREYLYYEVLDPTLSGGEASVEIEVDYYDAGTPDDRLAIEYDSSFHGEEKERFHASVTALKTGQEGWHTHRFILPQAFFGDREPLGADFRIWDGGDGREVIGRVAVSRMRP